MIKKFIAIVLMLLVLTSCAPKAAQPQATPEMTAEPTQPGQNQSESVQPEDVPAEDAYTDPDGTPAGILSTFATMDLDGNEVTAESALGEYDLVMINVWATFCGPCIHEMPDLAELSQEYADKNVRIVGIVSDAMGYGGVIDEGVLDAAREIVEQTGADYLHLQPSDDLLHLLSQISAVPTSFFVDKDGVQVGKTYMGAKSKDQWAAIIEETLALTAE